MLTLIEKLVAVVKEDSSEALGCTEPVAVAFAGNVAGRHIDDKTKIQKIVLLTSKSVYKNGKSVKIPNTGAIGLDLAAAVGVLADQSKEPFLVFSKVDRAITSTAQEMIEQGKVSSGFVSESPDVYVKLSVITETDEVEVVVAHAHTHLQSVVKNGSVIYEDSYGLDKADDGFDMKALSFAKLKEIIDSAPAELLMFTLAGVDVNQKAAREGLRGYGSKLAKTLDDLKQRGILSDNFITKARIQTAAAADMRMGGGECPIMTSGGSGNQGIGVILPIALVAEEEGCSREKLARALFFGHCINRYVKEHAGKLSGICGCAIGSGIGASAGIAYLLGGDDEQIAGACTNIYANLTGIVCDGAKESCSLKLSTSAEESIIAAYIAVSGTISKPNVGIIGDTIEQTISNIGKLSHGAFTKVDDMMLELIDR